MQLDINCQDKCDYYSDNRIAIDAAQLSLGVALGRKEFIAPLIKQGKLVAPFASVESGKGYDLVCPNGMEHRAKFQALSNWLTEQLRDTH